MHDSRLYFASDVLPDGRVLIAGGEYGISNGSVVVRAPNSKTAEVYDPQLNAWTLLPDSGQDFYDAISKVVSNGTVLISPVFPSSSGGTVFFDPVSNTWMTGPQLYRGVYQDEATWVKLPDQSILTIDPFGTNSERYLPSLNIWIDDDDVPVALYDSFGKEIGAAFMVADGRAFFLGSTGHTAFYTPSGSSNPGTWTAGPDIPGLHGTPDAPAAMMVNGKILCAVSPVPTSGNHFPTPTTFYEFDPVANAFTAITGPTGASINLPSYDTRMLVLPGWLGTVLARQLNAVSVSARWIAVGRRQTRHQHDCTES